MLKSAIKEHSENIFALLQHYLCMLNYGSCKYSK